MYGASKREMTMDTAEKGNIGLEEITSIARTVLGMVLFNIFIKELRLAGRGVLMKFANETKLGSFVKTEKGHYITQEEVEQ